MLSTSFKATLKAFIWAHIHWILLGLIALGLFLYIITSIQSCSRHSDEKKQKQDHETILKEKGKIEILEEEKKSEKQIVNQTEINSSRAADNVNRVFNTDSSTRNASRAAAKREFCKDHPSDSKCR